jgi:hypothetical protein
MEKEFIPYQQALALKEFIPYQQALALKELGFDEPCFRWYDERWGDDLQQDKFNTNKDLFMTDLDCSAPLYQQAFRWFREKYGFYNQIHKGYGWEGIIRNSVNGDIEWNDGTYNSPEEAELACLIKLIEIVKNK